MVLNTKLIQEWLGEPDESRRLRVLDVGSAMPETVDFFAGYRCRLHFLDLVSELPLCDPEELSISTQFESLLAFPEETQFDLCLFWDLFSYLDGDAIVAFLQVLQPYLSPDARCHALGVMNTREVPARQHYGLLTLDQMRTKPFPNHSLQSFAHSPAELRRLLSGLDIRRSMMLSSGQLEMLLQLKSNYRK